MEEAAAKVDTSSVSGDMVDESTVRESGAGARGQTEGAIVDRCNETAAEEYTRRCYAVEVVMLTDSGQEFHA